MLRYTVSGWIALIMYYAPFIAVPILAYRFNNWWFLFGIIISFIGTVMASNKYKFIILAVVAITFLSLNYYTKISQTISFYFLSFMFGFVLMILYRLIGFGDRTSRALIAASGNKQAREEIEKDIEERLKNQGVEKENK